MHPWLALGLLGTSLHAVPVAVAQVPSDAPAPSAAPSRSLPPLPSVPSLQLPPASPSELQDLAELLGRLTGTDAAAREAARAELLELQAHHVPAIAAKIDELAKQAERERLRQLLDRLREQGRKAERERLASSGQRGKVVTPDYLGLALDAAEPTSRPWRELTQLLGLARALAQVGTVEATRELIGLFVRFGELLRVDVQLRLEKMGDAALPALIEARRHPAEKVGRWASRLLDTLGKSIPSEVLQTPDQAVLADALRAYGRTKDLDAARVIISFANSERAQVREAARQAVTLLGEASLWQLRDAYEDLSGKRPPRDWSWDRLARELFMEFDRLRSAEVEALFERGVAAGARGQLLEQKQAFDALLTRDPAFPERATLSASYLRFAESSFEQDPEAALDALLRAERLSDSEQERKTITSLRLTLDVSRWLEQGVIDSAALRQALELAPGNERARRLLASTERGELSAAPSRARYLGAGALALLGAVAIGLLAFRRGRAQPAGEPPPEPLEPTEPSTGSAAARARRPPSDDAGAPAPDAAPPSDSAGASAPDAAPPSDGASAPAPDAAPPSDGAGASSPDAVPPSDGAGASARRP